MKRLLIFIAINVFFIMLAIGAVYNSQLFNPQDQQYPNAEREICEKMNGFVKNTDIRPPTNGLQLDYAIYGLACVIPIEPIPEQLD